MAQEKALVLETYVHANSGLSLAKVKTQRQSACQSCELKSGCGQGLLNQLSNSKGLVIDLENRIHAIKGDIVLLSLPDEGLVSAALLMFIAPLIGLIVGGGLGAFLSFSEPIVAFCGLVGFGLGLGFVRLVSARREDDPRFKPVMSALVLDAEQAASCKIDTP